MENKKCEECGKDFMYVLNPQFPRKYCPACSQAKKASYQAKQSGTPSDNPQEKVEVAKEIISEIISGLSAKDEIIVAQVILKGAVEIVAHDGRDRETVEDLGRVICGIVNELTGAYKLALSNVKAL